MRKLIMFGCLFLSMTAYTQKKYIWLRGLESERYPNSLDAYQQSITGSNGYVIDYQLNNTISGIASKIYHDAIKPVEHENEYVVIGYGMGGLIARSLQFLSPGIKAIITIGTPNAGSVWLKNTLNGKAYDFFSKAIRLITRAVDNSLYSGIFNGVTSTTLASPIVLPISTFKSTTVTGGLNELKLTWQTGMGIYALSHPCIREMLPGSAFLTNLNAKAETVPHINIYGAEHYWQVVRAVGSMSNKTEVNNQQQIDKLHDQEYILKIQSGLAFISHIQTSHDLVYNSLTVQAIHIPRMWLTRELVHNARLEWDGVSRYLDISMHADFAANMGAVEYRLQDYCILGKPDMQEPVCKQAYLPFVKENDGVYSKDDITSGFSAQHQVIHVKASGVNQYEVGNHLAVRRLLEDIIIQEKYGEEFAK